MTINYHDHQSSWSRTDQLNMNSPRFFCIHDFSHLEYCLSSRSSIILIINHYDHKSSWSSIIMIINHCDHQSLSSSIIMVIMIEATEDDQSMVFLQSYSWDFLDFEFLDFIFWVFQLFIFPISIWGWHIYRVWHIWREGCHSAWV